METKTIKLVALYARVSTGKQENEQTIKNQLMVLEEKAKKEGYTIIRKYIDEGWSGDTLARPNLDQLRQDARNKIWEAVLIYDPDRLARRGAWQELVIEELKDLGIEVLFATIPPPKNDEDVIMYKLRGVFAEYERMKIKERFRLGKLRKAKEGHIVSSEAPYGYRYILRIDDKHGYYEIYEPEARVVRMIFDWVTKEHLTLRAIVRRLQENKIYPRESSRKVWSTSTLSTLLRRTTYIGKGHYMRSYATLPEKPLKKEVYKKIRKTSRKLRPVEEWIIISTPVIIAREQFEEAGRILRENFAMCVRNKKNEYLLGGKIYCNCGRKRTGEGPQHGKHLYYRCTDRVYSFPLPPKCQERGINARIADKLVWGKISKFMASPDLIKKEAKKWLLNHGNEKIEIHGSEDELLKNIEKLKSEQDRYAKAYGAEAISLEKLKEYTAESNAKITLIRSQISALTQQKRQIFDKNSLDEERLEEFCKRAENVLKYLNFDAKQKIVREVVEKITATQKEMVVEGYLPINSTEYVEYKTIHRNCGFAQCWQVHAF